MDWAGYVLRSLWKDRKKILLSKYESKVLTKLILSWTYTFTFQKYLDLVRNSPIGCLLSVHGIVAKCNLLSLIFKRQRLETCNTGHTKYGKKSDINHVIFLESSVWQWDHKRRGFFTLTRISSTLFCLFCSLSVMILASSWLFFWNPVMCWMSPQFLWLYLLPQYF